MSAPSPPPIGHKTKRFYHTKQNIMKLIRNDTRTIKHPKHRTKKELITSSLPSAGRRVTMFLFFDSIRQSLSNNSRKLADDDETTVPDCDDETTMMENVTLASASRSVTFNPNVQTIASNIQLTEEEKHINWWTPKEYKSMRKHAAETVVLIQQGGVVNEPAYCERGLETLVEKKACGFSTRRRVRTAVLVEQKLQQTEGVCDPELLAMASSDYSMKHADVAYLRGLTDEQNNNIKSSSIILAQEHKLLQRSCQTSWNLRNLPIDCLSMQSFVM
jgi:hypothetical protein